jgi:hypothetical protein
MTRNRKAEPRARLHLDVPVRVKEELEVLRVETESDSLTEVVRHAIQVYGFAVRAKKEGRSLLLYDADGTSRELLLLGALPYAPPEKA